MSKISQLVEALIFSFGEGISMDDLARRTKGDKLLIKRTINELNRSYDERKSAFVIETEGNLYRMRLRNELSYVVEDLLKTDMRKGVLMTLSIIASKGKIKQAELKNMRGSVVYRHVKELSQRGLILVQKEGNSKVIKIAPTFFDYFDINSKEFKELYNGVKEEVEKESEQSVEYRGN
jgi:segregation and condensation protein B